jgi:regulatory protein
MKITAIKQQVKRADRYSIYIDGKYSFSLSEGGLLNTGLSINQEFSKEGLAELKDRAVIDKGYGRALNLISHRPRSEWEIRDYLIRKDYGEDTTNKIVNMLSGRGYINDTEFARRWVANRRLLKSISKRRLMLELRQKRIADEIIQSVLNNDETDEHEVLRELVERKRKQTKYQDNLKLMQYLVRQGFSYDDIKSVINKD